MHGIGNENVMKLKIEIRKRTCLEYISIARNSHQTLSIDQFLNNVLKNPHLPEKMEMTNKDKTTF